MGRNDKFETNAGVCQRASGPFRTPVLQATILECGTIEKMEKEATQRK